MIQAPTRAWVNEFLSLLLFIQGLTAPFATNVGFTQEINVGGSGAVTINWALGNKQCVTLTANSTMIMLPPNYVSALQLKVIQGGAGSYTITSWSPYIKWAYGAAPSFSTAVGAVDIWNLYYDGSAYYGQSATGFA
jgi:hypothetical protein